MIYSYEKISFFTTTLSGWDITGYHLKSLLIIKNRHNFGHNLWIPDKLSSYEFH
jgi:hypothetical protein